MNTQAHQNLEKAIRVQQRMLNRPTESPSEFIDHCGDRYECEVKHDTLYVTYRYNSIFTYEFTYHGMSDHWKCELVSFHEDKVFKRSGVTDKMGVGAEIVRRLFGVPAHIVVQAEWLGSTISEEQWEELAAVNITQAILELATHIEPIMGGINSRYNNTDWSEIGGTVNSRETQIYGMAQLILDDIVPLEAAA